MITENDLLEAIAECQGQRNPNANTCIKLAAFYTIKRELFGDHHESEYSYAASDQKEEEPAALDSGTEFAQVISKRSMRDVLSVIDELMSTLQVIQPRLYDAVLDKLY